MEKNKNKNYPFACERENDEWFGSATEQTAKGRKTLKWREKEEAEVKMLMGQQRVSFVFLLTFAFCLISDMLKNCSPIKINITKI